MRRVTIVIADRDRARLETCTRLLRQTENIRVVGRATSATEALARARLKPRVLLLDLDLYAEYRGALLRTVRRMSPRTRVIVLARRSSEASILDALSGGARGYLAKRLLGTWLPTAVRKVDAGEVWIPRRMVTTILARLTHLGARGAR